MPRGRFDRYHGLLLACGLGMLLVYGGALLRFPLLRAYNRQILTLDRQVLADPGLAPILVSGSALLCLLYIVGYLALSALLRGREESAGTPPGHAGLRWAAAALVILMPLIALGLLLFTYPISSLDLYDYLYRGHVAARYGANNFIQSPEDFRALDRLYWYTAWRRATTAYGPLWEALSILVAQLSGTRLLALLIGFKITSAIGWLLCGLVIGWVSRPGQRLLAGYLWLWNPLVLWELVGAGHNDGWMLLFGLLAYGAVRRRPVAALLLITVGALFKYPLALLWPVLLCAALARLPSWRARAALILRAGLLCAALAVSVYLPWWAGPAMLAQITDRAELFTNSPLAVLRALWLPHGAKGLIEWQLAWLGLGLLGGGVAIASVWAARRPQHERAIGAGLLIWSIAACSPWAQPWYLVWPIGLLALQPRQVRPRVSLALVAFSGLLVYPAYSALRPLLGWPGDGAAWQILIVALLYLPPCGVALYRLLVPQPGGDPPAMIGAPGIIRCLVGVVWRRSN